MAEDFIVMYHGMVAQERGVESLLRLLEINSNIKGIILGDDSCGGKYINELKSLAKKKNISNRLYFHKAVSHSELKKYVGAVDVGLIVAPAICKNHLYSLPNKFFENIQSETPVICPNYPTMKCIVDEYGFGLTCDPEDIDDINKKIELIRTDKELYNRLKENVKRAKAELCWENEKKILRTAYKEKIMTVS